MTEKLFDGNFLYYVRLMKRLYETTLTEAAKALNLTLPEADVLCFLRENPEFDTARDVSVYRDVSRAYVSRAVEALAGKRLIEIRQDKADRRYQHLTITERAKPYADALHKAQFEFYSTVTSKLSDNELLILMELIGKCAASVESAVNAER